VKVPIRLGRKASLQTVTVGAFFQILANDVGNEIGCCGVVSDGHGTLVGHVVGASMVMGALPGKSRVDKATGAWQKLSPIMTGRFTPPPDTDRYSGFIFDCDGTLADTMPAHHLAWQQALREGGATFDFHWDLFVSRAGMSMEGTVLELSEQFSVGLDSVLISRRQRELFGKFSARAEPVHEVLEFARLVAQRAPVSVASGSSRTDVLRSLEIIGAKDLFSVVITPEDVTRGKPAPDMFLLASDRMGVAAADCLVIEDSKFGIEAARRAGMDYAVVAGPHPARNEHPSM
jgi:beta-phosphoglucomutase-like phosphatase (HAD superfamily)